MTAELIDGRAVAERVRREVADGVAEFLTRGGRPPGLATVLVGDDAASELYVRHKRRACAAAGMADLHRRLPADTTARRLGDTLDELAEDPDVSGILLQLPL